MENEVVSTVPHMHLFMELKRKFPELKDADITDCIQRFGLHRDRCEEELSKRIQEHQRNYNSPWNLSRATSRSSTGSRTSPHSDAPHTLSPLHNGSSSTSPQGLPSPTTPLSQQNSSSCFSDSEDEHVTKPSPAARIGMPTFFRQIEEKPYSGDQTLPTSPEHQLTSFNCTQSSHINNVLVDQKSNMVCPTSGLSQPNSAPIVSPSLDPFIYSPNRRSSTETESERLKRILNSPNIAGIQEQLTKKEKLQEVLNRRLEEKAKLEDEVKELNVELESKEMNQILDVEQCKKRIEFIQHENSRLQFVCDEMEREILESGETPQTDQDGRRFSRLAVSNRDVSMPAFSESNQGPPQPILRASSTSSLHSSRAGTPATPTMPSRRAPSPPIHVPISPAGPGPEPDQLHNHTPDTRPVHAVHDDSGWACSKCTFENSPYLNECEMCGFPHFPPAGTPPSSLAYQHPHAGGSCYCHHRHHQYNLSTDNHGTGELQDIHIQVRHQNLHSPSNPPYPSLSYGANQYGWNS